MPRKLHETTPQPEKVICVGLEFAESSWPLDESLAELERLVETDGGQPVATITQRLDKPNPRTFIGKGKLNELKEQSCALNVDVVVFDDELSPSQQANLERELGKDIKVIDRTALILDIFGQHAQTREGRLQVQLAQLQYLYPRLRGMWSHLVGEQTRGGIGSRFGQGESQLEVDRRLIRNRISKLKQELKRLDTRRSTQAKARWDSGILRIALAGYTNAGKSTLLNYLTDADVYAKDELFATLDPTTRAFELEEGRRATITDTVGFIQKLPTTLIESFRSTLAEVCSADIIIELVDASDDAALRQLNSVDDTLAQIGAHEITRIVSFNKCDLLTIDELASLKAAHSSAEFISAATGMGVEALLWRIAREASANDKVLTCLIPYNKGMLTKMIHERCQIMHESYEHNGLVVTLKASQQMQAVLEAYEFLEKPQEQQ